jgi:hypothetical protein
LSDRDHLIDGDLRPPVRLMNNLGTTGGQRGDHRIETGNRLDQARLHILDRGPQP